MDDTPYRDRSKKTLTDYPRPSVAVDTAVLTLDPEVGLVVLEVRRPATRGWALPGTFLHEGEVLADAVGRSLRVKANVEGLQPRQLHVFDALDRDERGWVLSVAHVDVVKLARLDAKLPATTRLVPVDAPGNLPYDHPSIVAMAVDYLRSRYATTPDPDRLLGETFTMHQLLLAHNAIAGHELQRDWFRRTMKPQLVQTEEMFSVGRGRPAKLYRRAPDGVEA